MIATEVLKNEAILSAMLDRKGAYPITMETETTPRLVAGNPFSGIVKRSRVNGMANWIYTNSVNNQRKRESATPDFEAKPRKWGHRLKGTPFVVHTKDGIDRVYVELKVERSIEHAYFLDDKEIPAEDVQPWLPKRKEGRQELKRPVILRDYRLDSIKSITLNGMKFILH